MKMSIQLRTVTVFAGACLALCAQAALAGPPRFSASVPPLPKTGTYTDHSKDDQKNSKKDTAQMGLTSSATSQRLNSTAPGAAVNQPQARKPVVKSVNQNRRVPPEILYNLNVVYDAPTYDMYGPSKNSPSKNSPSQLSPSKNSPNKNAQKTKK